MITVNIKMMSGDIIPITYDSQTENISDIIEQHIPYDSKNYVFKLFDNENKEENAMNIFFYQKTFNVSIFFLENSIFWFSGTDTNKRTKNVNSSSWIDYIFYKKYLVRASHNNHTMEYVFYHRKNNSTDIETFIPFSSIKILSHLNQADNVTLDNEKPVYSSLIDMIDQLLPQDFSGSTREDLLKDIYTQWINHKTH